MFTSFAILGSGSWGTAVALHLAQTPGRRVHLWSARESSGEALARQRENPLLPGVPIPAAVALTTDLREVAGSDLFVTAAPTAYLRATLRRVGAAVGRPPAVLSLTKGLENDTFLRPTEIIAELLGTQRVGVLSGPSHAEEVSRGLPTSLVVASADPSLAQAVQASFTGERFRVYTNPDTVGVELAAALKNVIGLAAGISDGLDFGDNTKSALMTRGLLEMTRFGVALGAEAQTFQGLAGMGDLITTCVSRHGRNRRVGERLGRGEKLRDILASMTMVAEGVNTTRSVHDRARKMGLELPIVAEIYRVLYEDKDPLSAVNDLMLRAPRPERGA